MSRRHRGWVAAIVGAELLALFASVLFAVDSGRSLASALAQGHLVMLGALAGVAVLIKSIIWATDWVDRGY
jgi:hypothetical protein